MTVGGRLGGCRSLESWLSSGAVVKPSLGYWCLLKQRCCFPGLEDCIQSISREIILSSVLFFSKKWKALAQSHFLLVSLLYYYCYLQLCRKASLCSVLYKHRGKIGPLHKEIPQKALRIPSQTKQMMLKCSRRRELFMPMATSSAYFLSFL